MKKTRFLKLILICLVLLMPLSIGAESKIPRAYGQGDGVVKLRNDFIEIVVNTSTDGTGRFAVITTGGDPERTDDNDKYLIYGLGKPVTSYSTIRIDNKNYVFGGKTTKRAGLNGNYGTQITPPVQREDGIYTSYRYGDILVEQILDLTFSTTTGQPDTAAISYVFTNQGSTASNVGLRVVLDTMLGDNDGAPFRVGDVAVVSDTLFTGISIPVFMQAFDDLLKPAVMAQGNLSGPEVTCPSRVYFSNWGSFADGAWDFNYVQGRDFTRAGEFDLDSAMALYWDPEPLQPGQSKRYVTHYGLGGISIAKGFLSLGLSSVNKVEMATNPQPFDVIGYIQNTGDGIAHAVVAKLKLPKGLAIVGSTNEKFIDKMQPGESKQVVWKVVPTGNSYGNMQMVMEVDASNIGVNTVSRQIEVTTPAKLSLNLEGPLNLSIVDEKLFPEVFEVTGRISNTGGSTAYNVELELSSAMLNFVKGEQRTVYVGTLPPNQDAKVTWKLTAKPVSGSVYPSGRAFVSLTATASNAESPAAKNLPILLPKIDPKVWLRSVYPEPRVINNSLVIHLDLMATNIERLKDFKIELNYDPQVLQFLGWRVGTQIISTGEGEWKRGPISVTDPYEANKTGKITIEGQIIDKNSFGGSLAELKFILVGKGKTKIGFNSVTLTANEKDVKAVGFEIEVR